jgi:hypothetical protein
MSNWMGTYNKKRENKIMGLWMNIFFWFIRLKENSLKNKNKKITKNGI